MINKYIIFTIAFVAVILPGRLLAHPGRTDSTGGHTCRTNCTQWGLNDDEYHKHNNAGGYTNSKGQEYDKNGNLIQPSPNTPEEPKKVDESTTEPELKSEPAPSPTQNITPEQNTNNADTKAPKTDTPLTENQQVNPALEEGSSQNEEQTNDNGSKNESDNSQSVIELNEPATQRQSSTSNNENNMTGIVVLAIALSGGSYYVYKKYGKNISK